MKSLYPNTILLLAVVLGACSRDNTSDRDRIMKLDRSSSTDHYEDDSEIALKEIKKFGPRTSRGSDGRVAEIILDFTEITNSDLAFLNQIDSLTNLSLKDTDISDAGLIYLRTMSNLAELVLDRTEVTDDGLEHLSGLVNLRLLSLNGTDVTEEGVKKLKAELPTTNIFATPKTTLPTLEDLPKRTILPPTSG